MTAKKAERVFGHLMPPWEGQCFAAFLVAHPCSESKKCPMNLALLILTNWY